jgi:hypothetical protein
MSKLMMIVLVGATIASSAFAGASAPSPEIDAGTGVAALTLLSGAVLILRARRRQ